MRNANQLRTRCYDRKFADIQNRVILLQVHQRLHSLLDRRLAIEAVDIEQINILNTELLQALHAGCPGVIGRAVDGDDHFAAFKLPSEAVLRGEEDILTALGV